MAFFKFRKGDGESVKATTAQPESVEAMRKRARQRLIGAAVLVLAGVIGFPLLFDTQPRPVAVNIPIDIPDRQKAPPLAAPQPAQKPVAAAAPPSPAPAAAPVQAAVPEPAEPAPAPPQAVAQAKPQPAAQPESKPEPKPASKPEPRPQPAVAAQPAPANDAVRAQALLEGKAPEQTAAAAEGRFIVQVGAFADAVKAREARLKLERAGLKTYTHVAETKDGKRVRVRVGPFANRADADKAARRIKGLDLPAAILTL